MTHASQLKARWNRDLLTNKIQLVMVRYVSVCETKCESLIILVIRVVIQHSCLNLIHVSTDTAITNEGEDFETLARSNFKGLARSRST